MRLSRRLLVSLAAAGVGVAGLAAGPATANHSWGGYHWARTSNPFTLKLGDNLSSNWKSYLSTTSSDWSKSSVLDTTIVAGSTTSKRCAGTPGRVEVCNYAYGQRGWVGIASIWLSGSHITQGVVKLNDTYFAMAKYNTPAWRNVVMCQEVGHTLGLDHQDENFNNADLNTCMDYSNNAEPNQHPNAHDYALLETIYAHVDGTTTLGATVNQGAAASAAGAGNGEAEWGKAIRYDSDGRPSMFERDLGNGQRVVTFVTWAR